MRLLPGDGLNADDAFVARLMRQPRRTCDVADGVKARDIGFAIPVGDDVTLLDFAAERFEAEVLDIPRNADRDDSVRGGERFSFVAGDNLRFNAIVVEKIISLGIQLIILTQDQKTSKELQDRYLDKDIKCFLISMDNPTNGTSVRNAADTLAAKIARVEILIRSAGHPDLRKQACRELRDAAEPVRPGR